MTTRYANLPPYKRDLFEAFGHLYFQCSLINLDVVGIRIKRTQEVLIILYRGPVKLGWIYEGGELSQNQILTIYNDVPEDFNLMQDYENRMSDKVEILIPQKDNYVFIDEGKVQQTTKTKYYDPNSKKYK